MKNALIDCRFQNVKFCGENGNELSITERSDSKGGGLGAVIFESDTKSGLVAEYGEHIPESVIFDILKKGLDEYAKKQ